MQEMQETHVWPLGQEDPREKEMTTHSSSCLGNPMDRGAWWATGHGVAKSQTWLSERTHKERYLRNTQLMDTDQPSALGILSHQYE